MSSSKYSQQTQEDYAGYLKRMEKTTSIIEGPHFPNLHAIYKHKEGSDQREQQQYRQVGRFGEAVHLERFETIADKST